MVNDQLVELVAYGSWLLSWWMLQRFIRPCQRNTAIAGALAPFCEVDLVASWRTAAKRVQPKKWFTRSARYRSPVIGWRHRVQHLLPFLRSERIVCQQAIILDIDIAANFYKVLSPSWWRSAIEQPKATWSTTGLVTLSLTEPTGE